MAKSPVPDYEPVRPGRSRLAVEEDDWFHKSPATVASDGDAAWRRTPSDPKTEAPVLENHEAAAYLPDERITNQRTHGFTFAGLMVFTFLVYFRPYELVSALSWTSQMAFYVALLTILIYVPTHVGLSGNLTSRLLEVRLVLLLLVTCVVSIPFALDKYLAWSMLTEFIKVVVIFVVMVNVVRTEGRLKRLIILVLIASCIVSVSALHDYRTGNLSLQGRRIEGVIGGLLSNPNDLALHLVSMVPIAFGLAFARKNPIVKLSYLACMLLMIGGIVATFSRGGFLALMCVAVYLSWNLAQRNRVLVGALVLALMLAALVLVPSAYLSRISNTGDASASTRLDDLKRSIYLTVRHPLVGVGMGNYVLYSNSSKVSHNSYTQVGSELGIAAMMIYVLFLVHPIRGLRRIRKQSLQSKADTRVRWLLLGLEGGLVGYMVASFFASVAFHWYAYYLVGFSVCMRRITITWLDTRASDTCAPPVSFGR